MLNSIVVELKTTKSSKTLKPEEQLDIVVDEDTEIKFVKLDVNKEAYQLPIRQQTHSTKKRIEDIVLDEVYQDEIEEESENQTVFYVTNTGKKPLVIDNVSASCGWTTPTKPEQPIMPGKKDKIEVVFHPKPGQLNEQEKTVTVVANTEPKMVVLKIKAFVEPRDKN
jgi:hypothetical protein